MVYFCVDVKVKEGIVENFLVKEFEELCENKFGVNNIIVIQFCLVEDKGYQKFVDMYFVQVVLIMLLICYFIMCFIFNYIYFEFDVIIGVYGFKNEERYQGIIRFVCVFVMEVLIFWKNLIN